MYFVNRIKRSPFKEEDDISINEEIQHNNLFHSKQWFLYNTK